MTLKKSTYKFINYFLAWSVHAFTASAAFVGILTLVNIYHHQYRHALWLMGLTVIIDALDGTFARWVRVKEVLPKIDGALLDNIVDYLNYVITPCFFLLIQPDMLPAAYATVIVIAVTITSSYQFCQADAKTPDHFFKGFPCYWNFAIFYMVIFNTSMITNALLLSICCVLVFVPIKYIYPSRIDYLTKSKHLRNLVHAYSILYGISTGFLLWHYPENHPFWLAVSLGYIILYIVFSLYRTYFPMDMSKGEANNDIEAIQD